MLEDDDCDGSRFIENLLEETGGYGRLRLRRPGEEDIAEIKDEGVAATFTVEGGLCW